MSEEVKKMNEVDEEIEVMYDEVEDAESEPKESKFKAGLKKYGKKIAIGAGILAVGIAGFMLGRKGSGEGEEPIAIGYDSDNGVDDSEDTDETE